MNKKLSASKIYLIYTAATSFFFSLVFTVSSIYYIDVVKLNPLQLVLVGTVLEASYFLFEIPTGIVADIYSRKLSIIIGLSLVGLGFMLEGSVPFYLAVLLAQVLWGVGATFLSGADDAWIADEVGEENLSKTFLHATQIGQVFALAGILLSSVIGTLSLSIPMVIGGGLFVVLALFLTVFMPETGFNPISMDDKNTWGKMAHTFLSGLDFIKKSPLLISLLLIGLFYGLYSEGFDRLWHAHFLKDITFPQTGNLEPVIWFGIIKSIAMVLSIGAVQIIKRRLEKTGKLERVWLLIIINLLLAIGIIGFGLSGNFQAALMTYWSSYILRTANGPIYRAWMNQNIESRVRATVLSTIGQVDSLGQIISGPIIGFIALRGSIPTAIIFAGIILLPVTVIYFYMIGRVNDTKTVVNEVLEE